MLRLEKTIPARRHVVEFTWVTRFHPFGAYSSARKRMNLSVQADCFWCGSAFKDDDTTMLAGRAKGKNVLLCEKCADRAASGEGTAL